MSFKIVMGEPEMAEFWDSLKKKVESKSATKGEQQLYKKIGKALYLISENPRYPGLQTHEITSLTARYGHKVWQSYLENNTPAAGRIYWVYGPDKGYITVIGLEPHPNDSKSNAYDKVVLSEMGSVVC